jgi:DNA polymerase III delta subunit
MEVSTLMDLQTFKTNVLNGQPPTQLVVLLCAENFFIADQYINTLCAKTGKEKRLINSIFEQDSANSLVFDYTETINVLKTETFNEAAEDYPVFENTIIVCNKLEKKLESALADYIIKIPALKDWQVIDYIKQVCPELDDLEAKWLYAAAGKNIYKIESELDKVLLFHPKERKKALTCMRFSKDSDLFNLSIFELCDAIVYNRKNILVEYLRHRSATNFELMALVGVLLPRIRNLILVKHAGKSAVEIGISDGQHYYVTKDPYISLERLKNLLQTVSNIDLQLKSGLLDISKDAQIDYVISKLCE